MANIAYAKCLNNIMIRTDKHITLSTNIFEQLCLGRHPMKWILFVVFITFASVSSLTKADDTVLRVVIIQTNALPIVMESQAAFEKELRFIMPEASVEFDVYDAGGSFEGARAAIEAAYQVGEPDLIVSIATLATRALYQAEISRQTPKLFMTVADPVKEGIVTQFDETSSDNITGESHVLDAKVKLDMLQGLIAASDTDLPLTIGLIHTDYPSSASSVDSLLALESDYDSVKFVAISTPYVDGDKGLPVMREGIINALVKHKQIRSIDGLWFSTGPLLQAENLIGEIRKQTQLFPLFAESIESVQDGALLGVVSDVNSIGKSAAQRAAKILRGTPANQFPVSRMSKYTVAVNVSTAIKLGLPIPSSYLKLAKNNVYQ